jgi:hypothetical protein
MAFLAERPVGAAALRVTDMHVGFDVICDMRVRFREVDGLREECVMLTRRLRAVIGRIFLAGHPPARDVQHASPVANLLGLISRMIRGSFQANDAARIFPGSRSRTIVSFSPR